MKQWYEQTTNTKLEAVRLTFRLLHVYMRPLRLKVVFCKNIKQMPSQKLTRKRNMSSKNSHLPHFDFRSYMLRLGGVGSGMWLQDWNPTNPQNKSLIDISKQNYHSLKRSQTLFIKTKLQKLYTQFQQKGTQNTSGILELHFKTSH